MSTFGYTPPKFGKITAPLSPNNRAGPYGIGSALAARSPVAGPPKTPQGPGYTQDQVQASLAANPNASTGGYQGPPMPPQYSAPVNTAPTAPNAYDLNTDPALQQIRALTGMSNEQANAEALKERQQLLLSYGDPNLAAAILGQNDPTAQAAGQNPTSTVAQLGQQRDRNLQSLTEGLNQANLLYSGYRVNQEQQAAQDYQNALAGQAGQVNTGLDTIAGNLAAALSGNNNQLAQAISDAAARAQAQAAQTGIDPGAITDPGAAAAGGGAQNSGYAPNAPAGPPVGSTLNDLIYQLLGRKNDPAYQWA